MVVTSLFGFAQFFQTKNAEAAIPTTLGYQGRLKNSSGTAQTGTFSFIFRLYASSTGGTALYSETQPSVSVDSGFFAVQLGSVTAFPASLDFNQPLFITTEVNGDGEMSPRITINSVPYAYTAGGVSSFGTAPVSATGGRMYYNMAAGSLNYYDATVGSWRDISAAGASSTLQAVTTNGPTTTNQIYALGGISTLNLTATGTTSLQGTTLTNVTSTSVTTTNLAVTGGLSLATNSVTDAFVVNGLTIDSTGNVSATSITSGTLGSAAVTLALGSFGTITGTLSDTNVADNLTISGGTVNNTPIGATTPSTGIFTNTTSTNSTSTNLFTTFATVTTLNATGLIWTNATGTNTTSTSLFANSLGFVTASGTALTTGSFTVTGSGTSTLNGSIQTLGNVTSTGGIFSSFLTVAGQNVCLENGTNCPASSVTSTDLNWAYDNTSDFVRNNTSTTDLILGNTATSTGAPLYFDLAGQTSGTSTLYIGHSTNTNVIIGGTSSSVGFMNTLFSLNGNDLFVGGNIGSASSVYTNGSFVAGTGSMYYGDGQISKTNGNILFSASAGYILPATDLALSLGDNDMRFNGYFGNTTSTNATTTNLSVIGMASTTNLMVSNAATTTILYASTTFIGPGAAAISAPGYTPATPLRVLGPTGAAAAVFSDNLNATFEIVLGDTPLNNSVFLRALAGQNLVFGIGVNGRWAIDSSSGVFYPLTNNALDLGAATVGIRNVFVSGTIATVNQVISGNSTTTRATTTNLFVSGTASTTALFANGVTTTNLHVAGTFSGAGLVSDCSQTNQKLTWSSTTRTFGCGSDLGGNTITASSSAPIALSTSVTKILTATTTPLSTGNEMWVSAWVELQNESGATERNITVEIWRGHTCEAPSVQVGVSNVENLPIGITVIENTSISFVDSPATSTAVGYNLCATSDAGAPLADSRGIVLQEVNVGADLAEVYYAVDGPIPPGEVVSLDPMQAGQVRRSSEAHDTRVLGVVSERPGLVISESAGGLNPTLVALSGRIPVKVTTANGAIQPGDFLTSSDIPGVAMKATSAGVVIGQALSASVSEGEGKVMMFVKNTYFNGTSPVTNVLASSSTSGATPSLTADPLAGLDLVSSKVTIKQLEVLENLHARDATFDGHLSASSISAGSITSPELTALTLHAEQVSSSLQTLFTDLQTASSTFGQDGIRITNLEAWLTQLEGVIASSTLASSEVASSSLSLTDLYADGGAQVVGEMLFEGGLRVDRVSAISDMLTLMSDTFFFGRPYVNADSAGFAIIRKGDRSVTVSFEREYLTQPVIQATPAFEQEDVSTSTYEARIAEYFLNNARAVVTQKTTRGFTILLNKDATQDIPFGWTALAVKDARIILSSPVEPEVEPVAPVVTPPPAEPPASPLPEEPIPEPTPVEPPVTEPITEPTPPSEPAPSSDMPAEPAPSEPLPAEPAPVPETPPEPAPEPIPTP